MDYKQLQMSLFLNNVQRATENVSGTYDVGVLDFGWKKDDKGNVVLFFVEIFDGVNDSFPITMNPIEYVKSVKIIHKIFSKVMKTFDKLS